MVNSVILPFLHDPSYINDCLLYITALAEFSFYYLFLALRHPFAKENRSVVCSLIEFLNQLEGILVAQSMSQEIFNLMKQFYQ